MLADSSPPTVRDHDALLCDSGELVASDPARRSERVDSSNVHGRVVERVTFRLQN